MQDYSQQYNDFLEAASHDLHSPLRKLSVMIERLTTKNLALDSPEAKTYIDRINGCIAEMRRLIDNLGDLASANAAPVEYSSCDIADLINEIRAGLREEIEEKPVVFHLSSLPVIKADVIQIRQLFSNIIENAVKFGKAGKEVVIDITAEESDEKEKSSHGLDPSKKYFKITVADNGIGFDPAYAEKIFEPFTRLHAKSEYPGTGLGLAICRKIVTNHHGIIYAEGNTDGARFILLLPANL